MPATKHWTVEIDIGEDLEERATRAEARLQTDNTNVHGRGTARRNPDDLNVPQIGDELAVARALSDLAHSLLHRAAEDIERVTNERVTLNG
jgi:hypothetical protein